MELYWGSGSPFAWRVMLALEIKKIPYTSHLIEFSKDQTKTPEFLALNPRGKVPVIKDGDYVLSESMAILAYLDRKVPAAPLFGRTAEETGRVWKAVFNVTNELEPEAERIITPLFFNQTAEKGDELRAALKPLHAELALLNADLAKRPWIAGDAVSAADCVVLPVIESLLRAAGKDAAKAFDLRLAPLNAVYPNLAAWHERMKALPGFERTYPPHWRTAPQPVAAAE